MAVMIMMMKTVLLITENFDGDDVSASVQKVRCH